MKDQVRRLGTVAVLLSIVAAAAVAVVVGVAVRNASPTYRSEALLSIDEPKALAAADDAGVIEKLSRLRYKYVSLVGTERLAGPVAARLNMPVSDVRGRISASASPNDLLVRVVGSGSTAGAAKQAAEALAAELPTYADTEQVDNGIPGPQRVVLTVVDRPSAPERTRPARGRVLGAGVGAGLLTAVLVLGLAAVVEARRRRPGDQG